MSTITLEVDDDLLKKARFYAGPSLDNKKLIHQALTALIHIQVGRRLAARGGSQPDIKDIPRRNPWENE